MHVRGLPFGNSNEWQALCAPPCTASLPQGSFVFGVSLGAERTVASPDPIAIDGPARLVARYDSRKSTRAAGWVVFGSGMAVGSFLLLACSQQCGQGQSCSSTDSTTAALGAMLMIGGLVVGLPLGLT
ncbi:MAG: hypothetical protein HY898_32655 [Deltaproteobacteria bacterium]|nr:hypothetical protein [Deltaproteobacteria bacterium]